MNPELARFAQRGDAYPRMPGPLIIFRYLFKEVMTTTLAVSLVLLVIIMSGRFIKYLAQAAEGKLAADALFSLILYRVPGFLELIIPLGLFLGILLAYGRSGKRDGDTARQRFQ